MLAATPNVPHESAPDGFTDEDAIEVRRHLEPTAFDFEPRDHAELGALLGVLDIERGARTSGSRFVYLLGDLVFVQFALMRHAMDILADKGFAPVIPPVLGARGGDVRHRVCCRPTRRSCTRPPRTTSTSWARPRCRSRRSTMGEILDEADLPLRYAGYSTCFRREAGTYGKDMGGMFRVHQFDKVEMFSFATPESSWDEHEYLVGVEEEMMGNLEIPYPGGEHRRGRPREQRGEEVRHRGWLPGQDTLPRAHLMFEHDRLPGAAAPGAGSPGGRQGGDRSTR